MYVNDFPPNRYKALSEPVLTVVIIKMSKGNLHIFRDNISSWYIS